MSAQHEDQHHPPTSHDDVIALELVACPACDQPAEVIRRLVVESTSGPLEHIRIRCLVGHGFFMPVELLDVRGVA